LDFAAAEVTGRQYTRTGPPPPPRPTRAPGGKWVRPRSAGRISRPRGRRVSPLTRGGCRHRAAPPFDRRAQAAYKSSTGPDAGPRRPGGLELGDDAVTLALAVGGAARRSARRSALARR